MDLPRLIDQLKIEELLVTPANLGAPVRIVDLVEALIERQGRVPYEEVEIVFTGIGPGEKLEECLLSERAGSSGMTRGRK